MKTLRNGLILILCVCALLPAACAAGGWETVRQLQPTEQAEQADHVDVSVADGYIYVTTTRGTTVKVMSIVGQLISQQALPPGVSRLKVSAKGIYILKIGQLTRRVTI